VKPVRFGVIGVKGIGHYHCRFAMEHPAVALMAVADIDEDDTPEIAPGMDPAAQGHVAPDVLRAQFVAMMRSFHA